MGHVWTAPPWQELSELLQHWSGAIMCPACLCGREAAGHNALRGSGPNQKHAFKDALTHTGCPDPRIDLVCITSSVLANSFKRHGRCLSHLLESLWLTQPVYSTSMPGSGRRPQHQKRTLRNVASMSALPPITDILGPPKKKVTGTMAQPNSGLAYPSIAKFSKIVLA